MKITNREIVKIFNGIRTVEEKKLPVKLGFAINKNVKAMKGTAESYDAERTKILDKYGQKDEDGQLEISGDEYALTDKKAYAAEMNELLGIESELQVHTVTLDEIEKCDTEKFDALTPGELEILEFMIEE